MTYTVYVMRSQFTMRAEFSDGDLASAFADLELKRQADLLGVYIYGPEGVEMWLVDSRNGHSL